MLLVGIFEQGSYLLPLVVPTAALVALTTRGARRGVIAAIVLVTGFGALTYVQEHESRHAGVRAIANGMQEIAAEDPLFAISGTADDLGAFMMYEVRVAKDLERCWNLAHIVQAPVEQFHLFFDGIEPFLPNICMLISAESLDRLRYAAANGRLLVFAQNENWLDDVPNAKLLLGYLEEKWRLEPVSARGFDGFRVRPR